MNTRMSLLDLRERQELSMEMMRTEHGLIENDISLDQILGAELLNT